MKRGKKSKCGPKAEEVAPLAPSGEVVMSGPEVGSLYLIDNDASVRVTGRAWKFFDGADTIEVTVERADGTLIEEQLTLEEFEALTAGAKHKL